MAWWWVDIVLPASMRLRRRRWWLRAMFQFAARAPRLASILKSWRPTGPWRHRMIKKIGSDRRCLGPVGRAQPRPRVKCLHNHHPEQ